MAVVGIDGCRTGWFAVRLDDGWDVRVFSDIESMWHEWRDASLILIDIPIGLPDSRQPVRTCDGDARKLLGRPRMTSVFPSPGRAALSEESYQACSGANFAELGKKLTRQTWHILRKINEVEQLLRNDAGARSRVREIHPEVCFWAFNGGQAVQSRKKRSAGRRERLDILRKFDRRADAIREKAMTRYLRKQVAEDDILDAIAGAITANRPPDELAAVPAAAEYDACGLPMEMVYAKV